MLFMDGLSNPLRGWVKGHDPATLQEATKKALDLAPSSFRSRFQHRDSYMKKDKEKDTNLLTRMLSQKGIISWIMTP